MGCGDCPRPDRNSAAFTDPRKTRCTGQGRGIVIHVLGWYRLPVSNNYIFEIFNALYTHFLLIILKFIVFQYTLPTFNIFYKKVHIKVHKLTAINKLSNAFLRTAPVGEHCDGAGLWFRKRIDGGAQWILRYSTNGSRKIIGLDTQMLRSKSLGKA